MLISAPRCNSEAPCRCSGHDRGCHGPVLSLIAQHAASPGDRSISLVGWYKGGTMEIGLVWISLG
eukprot:1113354-Prymnesium_polylepis.1